MMGCMMGNETVEQGDGMTKLHYIEHRDDDARTIRFYGPTTKKDAERRAERINRAPAHSAKVVKAIVHLNTETHDLDKHGICRLCDAGDPTSVLGPSDEPCPSRVGG